MTLDNLNEKLSDKYACIIDKDKHKIQRDKGLNRYFKQWFKGAFKHCGKYDRMQVRLMRLILENYRGKLESNSPHQLTPQKLSEHCGKISHWKLKHKGVMVNESRDKKAGYNKEDLALSYTLPQLKLIYSTM